jgi:hypothetical protein
VASKHTTEQFIEQWKTTAPSTLDPPIFPSNSPSFAAASNEIPATIPEKLTFTFYMPHNCELNGEQVPQPIRPGFTGAGCARHAGMGRCASVNTWVHAMRRSVPLNATACPTHSHTGLHDPDHIAPAGHAVALPWRYCRNPGPIQLSRRRIRPLLQSAAPPTGYSCGSQAVTQPFVRAALAPVGPYAIYGPKYTRCHIGYPVCTDGRPTRRLITSREQGQASRTVQTRAALRRLEPFVSLVLDGLTDHGAMAMAAQVDMVMIPGSGGDFGVLPGHVPTVSALRPGVMEIHKTSTDISKV